MKTKCPNKRHGNDRLEKGYCGVCTQDGEAIEAFIERCIKEKREIPQWVRRMAYLIGLPEDEKNNSLVGE